MYVYIYIYIYIYVYIYIYMYRYAWALYISRCEGIASSRRLCYGYELEATIQGKFRGGEGTVD